MAKKVGNILKWKRFTGWANKEKRIGRIMEKRSNIERKRKIIIRIFGRFRSLHAKRSYLAQRGF